MPPPRLSEATLREAVAAYLDNGRSWSGAAAALGLPRTTFQTRLNRAIEAGLMPPVRALMPDFSVRQITEHRAADGALRKTTVISGPERGEPFAVPPGHVVKGVSAYTDADGRLIGQWVKTREDAAARDLPDVIRAAIAEHAGHATLPPPPADADADLLTFYPIADPHIGMYAWAEEAGEDYDLGRAAALLKSTLGELVAAAPPSREAAIVVVGDYFHADSADNRTARSGNALDVDTRYAKVMRIGVDLLKWAVEMAAEKHERVELRILPGNHDEHAAIWIALVMAAFYAGHERVAVSTDPSLFWYRRHGRVLLGATHGHTIRPPEMAGHMAATRAVDWGETRWRYYFYGHIHQRTTAREFGGVEVESLRTIAPRDSWAAGRGYTATRAMIAITYHRDHGERSRLVATVPPPAPPPPTER